MMKGKVKQTTVKRVLSKRGIKVVAEHVFEQNIILEDKIVKGTEFILDLTKPIPTPDEYSARLTDFEGAEECVIQFSGDYRTII